MIEELYEKLGKEIFGYCCALSGDPELAGDIMQDTFIRAMSNIDVLENLDMKQRRAWLYKTAKNIFIDRVRKAAMEQQKLNSFGYDELDGNAFDEIEAQQLLLLLPPELRTLFRMRYIDGYNSSELGEIFDLSPSTVRAKLSAAKKLLKAELLEE